MSRFNAKKIKDLCVEWIRNFFEKNGKGCSAIIGISGGKDSSVVAALCVEALGKDKVIGVLMPNGEQADISDSYKLVNHLGIKSFTINIKDSVDNVIKQMENNYIIVSEQTKINLPPRIRMSTLYAISQSNNGRVANTCNYSEDYVGYSTRYGDSAGDFAPIADLTVTEVKEIGRILGLPEDLIEKQPSDGLCGKTDEDNLGFTYAVLDRYIETGEIDNVNIKERIDYLHTKNRFKYRPIPTFNLAD